MGRRARFVYATAFSPLGEGEGIVKVDLAAPRSAEGEVSFQEVGATPLLNSERRRCMM